MYRFKLLIALTSLIIVLAPPAMAADNGFYLGLSAGQSAINTGDLEEIEISGGDTAFKAFAGYRFLNFFAVEGSYRDFGAPDDVLEDLDAIAEVDADAFDVFVMGLLPLGIADIFVKAGMANWDAEISAPIDGISETYSNSGTDPAYGIGVQFRIKSFAIRGEVEYFDIKETDNVFMYSIGGSYTF